MGTSIKNTILIIGLVLAHAAMAQSEGMATVKGGTYLPLYGVDSATVTVKDFMMDVYPVTNEEYLTYVKKYPEWQKSRAKRLFADGK